MKFATNILILFSLLMIFSCGHKEKSQIIDFSQKMFDTTSSDSDNVIRVAVASMTSPKETYVHYENLFNYLSAKTNLKFELIQRRTYKEVNELLVNGSLDFAFICSGAYVDLSEHNNLEILAVPQIEGKTTYNAYIITNKKNKDIQKFSDFEGRSFAFTDPLSNTGKQYALEKLRMLNRNIDDFFSNYIYTYGHDNSIKLVNNGIVDGATIDVLIFDYMKINSPNKIKNIRIVSKSENFGIPPVVAKASNMLKLRKIRNSLLNMHKDSLGKLFLRDLMIDKYVPGYDSLYNSIRLIRENIKK